MRTRDFHRLVRVIYRACRRLYGKEFTQDRCLDVFKVVFPELYKLRQSNDERVAIPLELRESLSEIVFSWQVSGELSNLWDVCESLMAMPFDWRRDKLIEFYEDILPAVMRIRKLTPTETGRLMGLRDYEVQKMYDAGLSNSVIYKLHGNSIVIEPMYYIFQNLFINQTPDVKKRLVQLSLFDNV